MENQGEFCFSQNVQPQDVVGKRKYEVQQFNVKKEMESLSIISAIISMGGELATCNPLK